MLPPAKSPRKHLPLHARREFRQRRVVLLWPVTTGKLGKSAGGPLRSKRIDSKLYVRSARYTFVMAVTMSVKSSSPYFAPTDSVAVRFQKSTVRGQQSAP